MRPSRFLSALACAGLLSLAACGGVSDSGDDSEAGGSATEPTGELDTMGFSLQDVIATSRADAFKQDYPDVDLKVAEGGFDEQQFLSAVASGEPPSLVYLPRSDLGTYAARGALTPLADCVEQQDIDVDQYRDSAVEQVTYDDELYGIPEFNSVRIVLASTAALKDAGLTEDDLDTADWNALAQSAEQLTLGSGGSIQRIGFDPKVPEFFPLWVAANGGQLLSDDGVTPAINSPEAVEAAEFAVSLVEASADWSEFKAYRDTWDFFGSKNMFVADQLGAFPMEDWYVDVLGEVSPKAAVTAVPFRGRDSEPLTYATGQAWAIPEGASNPDAACAFMKTVTATETWVEAAKASKADRQQSGAVYTGTFTANEEADEQIFAEVYEPTGYAGLDEATQVIRDVQDTAVIDPASPAGAEIRKAWEDAMLRILEGEQSAQESLDQAQEEAEKAIDEASP
jgi:multiple sugar transport system substrate-binding protein